MSTEMDTDEFDEASLQIEPDHSNAEQLDDDSLDEPLLDNAILLKVKGKVIFIREGRHEWEFRTIHSRAGKQMGNDKDWLKIIGKKKET